MHWLTCCTATLWRLPAVAKHDSPDGPAACGNAPANQRKHVLSTARTILGQQQQKQQHRVFSLSRQTLSSEAHASPLPVCRHHNLLLPLPAGVAAVAAAALPLCAPLTLRIAVAAVCACPARQTGFVKHVPCTTRAMKITDLCQGFKACSKHNSAKDSA